MLAKGKVHALDEGGVDLPALGREDVLDPRQGTEYHTRTHRHQPAPAGLLHPLRILQLGQGHPPGFWLGAFRPVARP